MTPILALSATNELNKVEKEDKDEKHHSGLLKLLASELTCEPNEIFDFELCLFDTQNASISGLNDEFLNSARLDNLMMSFCSMNAMIESISTIANDSTIRLVALFDNEEVGSNTAHGADSNMMETALKRLAGLNIGTPLKVFYFCNLLLLVLNILLNHYLHKRMIIFKMIG